LNPGGGTTEAENRRWGNVVPPCSPLLWPLGVSHATHKLCNVGSSADCFAEPPQNLSPFAIIFFAAVFDF